MTHGTAWSPPGRAVAFVLGLLLALTACSGTDVEVPRASSDQTDVRAQGATATLDRLAAAINQRDPARAASTAADADAQRTVRAAVRNSGQLDISQVSFRYIDLDRSGVPADLRARYGASAWAAQISVSYRLAEYDAGATQLDTSVVLVDQDGAQRIVGFGHGKGRAALWLEGPVRSAMAPTALVVSVDRVGRLARMAPKAVTEVRQVLPQWRGKLVIEQPASQADLERMLGVGEGEYDAIAAVTTSVDGALTADSPVHVFVNPAVFDRLGPKGAQVVLTHEATHVATGATFADMPTWLLEGFADYVALAHADVPVDTAASQILARVRDQGPPDDLPTPAELDPSAEGLGATYEEAWTVCRYLAAEYGEPTLVEFYRAVNSGEPVADAMRSVVGVSQARFVTGWKQDLQRLAAGGHP